MKFINSMHGILLNVSILYLCILFTACQSSENVAILSDSESPSMTYGISKLSEQLTTSNYSIITTVKNSPPDTKIVLLTSGSGIADEYKSLYASYSTEIVNDGFITTWRDNSLYVVAVTERGCLYGIMDIIDQLRVHGNIKHIQEKKINPAISFRAIKFNLPWAPYRPGPATEIHEQMCRDLKYWKSFLDMMVENRFNALTLWSNHLFPFMIRSRNYPKATPFDDDELEEWKTFWKSLFRMAKIRGIETYIVNWNIVVSEEFAENYDAKIYDDRSELVKKYTRESVTQLINEYEDLTGLGVTLADWMGNWGENLMTPLQREEWIRETFIDGMNQADRKVKFIHRAVLAGDPKEMRRVIDYAGLPEKTVVEVKFNWSHGHSTPTLAITHANNDGTIMREFWDPKPENYFIAWTIRNEDFFVLRWGNPEFIRNHIATNNHDYVDGYFIGSEGYIPAVDYSQKDHPHKTWDYAFQKQWLFYAMWGRLLFNPEETDESIAQLFSIRYQNVDALKLLKAYSLASETPLEIASFYKGTWDFTLYSEGFLAPVQFGFDDQQSPFISIEEMIRHETLAPNYLSIEKYCRARISGDTLSSDWVTPLQLADRVSTRASEGMECIEELRNSNVNPALGLELDDLEIWCNLGLYFADKIRAGVALRLFYDGKERAQQEAAEKYLVSCLDHWKNIISLTEDKYKPMPYVSMGYHDSLWPEFTEFHWKFFLKDVEQDLKYVQEMK